MACANTAARGSSTTRARNASARAINEIRTDNDPRNAGRMPALVFTRRVGKVSNSASGRRGAGRACASSGMPSPPPVPRLQQVHGQKRDQRSRQHHHGQGRGLLVLELLQLGDNQKRNNLRVVGHVP